MFCRSIVAGLKICVSPCRFGALGDVCPFNKITAWKPAKRDQHLAFCFSDAIRRETAQFRSTAAFLASPARGPINISKLTIIAPVSPDFYLLFSSFNGTNRRHTVLLENRRRPIPALVLPVVSNARSLVPLSL